MAETNIKYQAAFLKTVKSQVGAILESHYKLDINTREKIVASYFADDQLPHWYFYSNTPEEIARHLFIITQLLNANTDHIHHVSEDSRVITYLINVGRDFPGRLERVIEQNASMRIASFDSETTLNGVRIVSLEKITQEPGLFQPAQATAIAALKADLLRFGKNKNLAHTEQFIESLSPRYLLEEIQSTLDPRRAERHLCFYDRSMEERTTQVEITDVRYEDDIGRRENASRVMVGLAGPKESFIPEVLRIFQKRGINLQRTYFDLFRHPDGDCAILSSYFSPAYQLGGLESELVSVGASPASPVGQAERLPAKKALDRRIESILRRLPAGADQAKAEQAIAELRELCARNGGAQQGAEELGSFYLNCVTDFLDAADYSGLSAAPAALRLLLGYEAFDEFFVAAQANGVSSNVPGYRIKHSIARGPAKGGLRIDPIVSFDEVAALSFMMTWKCARSRILFGGAKGGLMLNPRTFEGSSIDFFDTLSSFGRSLFLVSGPLRDVPAGDVGCGPAEIGHLFEGFKSALRDLAMMAYGLKPGVSLIASQIVSVQEARRMLAEHFNLEWTDPALLRELVDSETYLELVAAAQITGKPKLGIAARGAATGLGMAYAVLAAVGNLYLEGSWPIAAPLSPDHAELLRKVCSLCEETILRDEQDSAYEDREAHIETGAHSDAPAAAKGLNGRLLADHEWETLSKTIFPALLKDKTMAVQGSGKVGGALIASLQPYGIKLIAVADAGGAIFGDGLDGPEVLAAVESSRTHPDKALRASCVHAKKNVQKCLYGTEAAAEVLELECDILAPAALENAITEKNAHRIRAKIEVCGANGPNSSRAEKTLSQRGVSVLYDFLANGAGVTASYFEWLRNLADRFKYEAVRIRGERFDPSCMDPYVMPEFKGRLKAILSQPEGAETTQAWNALLRDIMFAAVNEDWRFSREHKVSMKTAGFINSQFRVLAAHLSRMEKPDAEQLIDSLPEKAQKILQPFMAHPETMLFSAEPRGAAAMR